MGALLVIAEKDAEIRESLVELCRAGGYEILTAESRAELEDHLLLRRPHVVLADVALLEGERTLRPFAGGLDPFLVLLARDPAAAGELGEAVDLLIHPVTAGALSLCLARLERLHRLREERDELRAGHVDGAREALEGPSPAAARLRERVRRVAGTPHSTVLVTGEPGTRKELVAHAVHDLSTRAAGPFRVLSCATEESTTIRAVLCGDETHEGLLTRAAGGSLFLEEVSALSPEAQTLLAALLRERTFPVGTGGAERPLDARIIASTHRNLEQRTEDGLFLGDLYYRLNVLTIPVPPLRERREDLTELARYVLRRLPVTAPGGLPSLSGAAWNRLAAHDWPGNLRELRAVLVRAAFHAGGDEIQPGHLGLDAEAVGEGPGSPTLPLQDRSLRTMEKSLIRHVLAEEGGNRSRAARILGINRSTLYNKLRQYGLH